MTNGHCYEMLKTILDSLDPDRYPETIEAIEENIDTEDEDILMPPVDIARALQDADAALPMPGDVAAFIEEIYLEQIEDGSEDAANDLGSLYYNGRYGEPNYEKAVRYYTIAASMGSRAAAENLGYCYYYGRTGAPDYEKAFHYFALGAFDGHIISLYKIGDMYLNGYYVQKNESEAYLIYAHCAATMTEEAEHICGADVYMRLADCSADGIGTEMDIEKALRLYQAAEHLFHERVKKGDHMIRKNYLKCISRQDQLRRALQADLPDFDWAKPNND